MDTEKPYTEATELIFRGGLGSDAGMAEVGSNET